MNISRPRNNVRKTSTVSIDLSAEEWELLTASFPRRIMEKVANYLNKRFSQGFNIGMKPNELRTSMDELMLSFAIYGAYDTEPRAVLEMLIEKCYDRDEDEDSY